MSSISTGSINPEQLFHVLFLDTRGEKAGKRISEPLYRDGLTLFCKRYREESSFRVFLRLKTDSGWCETDLPELMEMGWLQYSEEDGWEVSDEL